MDFGWPIVEIGWTVISSNDHFCNQYKLQLLYKMKIWHRIYFGSLVNYKNPPN